MNKLAIFDFDGTLVDSGKDIVEAAQMTFQQLNQLPCDEATIRNAVGDGIDTFVERVFSPKNQKQHETALREFRLQYEHAMLEHTQLYPHIPDVLASLKASGWKIAICSNKPYDMLDKICQHLKLSSMVDLWLGGDSCSRKKPAPDPLMEICRQLEVERSLTIMVGDGEQDIAAGSAAGIPSIWVSWGGLQGDNGKGATATANEPNDLLTLLPKLLGKAER